MADYTILQTYPSNEDGYDYADVTINNDPTPRRLILPSDPAQAETVMQAYLTAPENQPTPVVQSDTTPLDPIEDQTFEVS